MASCHCPSVTRFDKRDGSESAHDPRYVSGCSGSGSTVTLDVSGCSGSSSAVTLDLEALALL